MSDIVKKYQHYFAESTRLQEMVNEQAAYIEELEAAILELSEGEIKIPFTGGKSLSWGHDADVLKKADEFLARRNRTGNTLRARRNATGNPEFEKHLQAAEKAAKEGDI
jgi:hypothetical protein